MLTPEQVKNHQFSASGRGTYRAAEVDDFFGIVSDSYEQVCRGNDELLKKIKLLAEKIEEYRADEDNIKAALVTAQRMADKIVKEARQKADDELKKATADAVNLISESEKTAEETVVRAQIKADNIVADAEAKADRIKRETEEEIALQSEILEKTKNEASSFRSELLNLYNAQLALIEKIPAAVEEERAEAEPCKEEEASEAAPAKAPSDEAEVSPEEASPEEEKAQTEFTSIEDERAKLAARAAEIMRQAELDCEEEDARAEEETAVQSDLQQRIFEDDIEVISFSSLENDDEESAPEEPMITSRDRKLGSNPDTQKDDFGEEPISFRDLFRRR